MLNALLMLWHFNHCFCREENKISASKPEKIDHRKTTWMNGFMMFSRYNRKKFIE